MSSTGQLIPKWQHPSETTFIFDNTVVEDTESVNPDGVRMIQVFASPKGIDNKLLEKTSLGAFTEEYGFPDFKRFGQSAYLPYTALSSGYAHAWCMRVMPDNAAYANVIYVAKIKAIPAETEEVDDGQGGKITKTVGHAKLSVKFEPFSQKGLNDANMFSTYMETMKNLTPDADGYIAYPYIGFRALGRGSYGGYLRARISHDVSSDKTNTYKNYTVALISTESGTKQKETFPGVAFTEDAIDPQTGNTIYINDVVNDYEADGSKRFAVEFMGDYHEAIFNFYKKNVDPETHLTAATFDIFGYDRDTEENNPYIEIVDGFNSIALTHSEGVPFANGDDGDFDDTVPVAKREETLDRLYQSAYSGAMDAKILSKRRAPANIILDANFSLNVKKQLVALTQQRMDSLCYLDCGLLTTVNDCLEFFGRLSDIDTYMVSKNAGMFKTKDPVTNKTIPVTITMWLAYKIPLHWQQYGMYTSMAAEDYATLSGYVKNSIRPEIDADDEDIKEAFYKARWNYIECTGENLYVRGTQQTSQKALSDLSEENNVHVMLAVKSKLEKLCAQKRYHLGEAADRKRYTSDANELFSSWKGVYLRSIELKFSMTKYEELRSILHCTCEITFNTIIKRTVIEIDINPRA